MVGSEERRRCLEDGLRLRWAEESEWKGSRRRRDDIHFFNKPSQTSRAGHARNPLGGCAALGIDQGYGYLSRPWDSADARRGSRPNRCTISHSLISPNTTSFRQLHETTAGVGLSPPGIRYTVVSMEQVKSRQTHASRPPCGRHATPIGWMGNNRV